MSFEHDKAAKDVLEALVQERSAKLKEYPRRADGRVPPDVCHSVDYQNDRHAYESAFTALRKFNALFVKRYAKELRQERRNLRG